MKTYRMRGLGGFFRGLDANILRNAVMNGSELSAYDYLKGSLVEKYGLEEDSFVTHLSCGTLAGIVGAICTSPPEVVKVR